VASEGTENAARQAGKGRAMVAAEGTNMVVEERASRQQRWAIPSTL